MSQGTGPGAITPDGCAVDLYAQLRSGPEPRIIGAAIPVGAAILELGCGTGRLTGALVRLGHPVVAVDESAEMLAHLRRAVPQAQPVRSRIQDLVLDRRFDVVLLASHLVNADPAIRRGFLDCCRRHVADGGCVIIQQHPARWFRDAAPSERTADGITFRLRDISRPQPGAIAATIEYIAGERTWTHSFTAWDLSGDRLVSALAQADLALDAYLTPDCSWLCAVPGL